MAAPLIIEMPGDVYEYVPSPLDWWQAGRYCKERFAELPPEAKQSELAALFKRLQSHHIQSTVWFNDDDGEVFLQRPKRRREYSHAMVQGMQARLSLVSV